MRSIRVHLVLLSALLVASGCGSRPQTIPVTGRVTLDGKPLKFGGVFFQPASGFGSGGAIGPDGRFEIRDRGGATEGSNRVAVSCYESDSPDFRQETQAERLTGRSLVPEKYASLATTDITIDVRPGMGEAVIALRSE